MKGGAIQIAAGIVLGTGIIALVGARLPVATEPAPQEAVGEAAAPVPIPPATAAVPVPAAAAAPQPAAWRKRAAPPTDVPAGVLVRAASSAKKQAGGSSCAPAEPEPGPPARDEPRPPVACAPGVGAVESVEIDWGAPAARQ